MITNIITNKWVVIGVVFIGLLTTIKLMNNKIVTLNNEVSTATINNKAYASEISGKNNEMKAFKFTYDQLKYYNDSINSKLIKTQKELKIKDKDIKSLQYFKENFNKKDTVTFSDTVFAKGIDIDTTLIDSFYTLKLRLKYPSTLLVEPTFINEKQIFIYSKKETIDPPKHFFIWRWFQKKQIVVEVKVVDSNKYATIKEQRLIEILK